MKDSPEAQFCSAMIPPPFKCRDEFEMLLTAYHMCPCLSFRPVIAVIEFDISVFEQIFFLFCLLILIQFYQMCMSYCEKEMFQCSYLESCVVHVVHSCSM